MRALTPLEARVLGVLVEKAATVPDTYPLSLNALVAGINQKTARDPVLNATEPEVVEAVDALKPLALVIEISGSRVARYEHNLGRVLAVPSQSVALLAVLALRGPQTASELRLHCERLHRFADTSAVEAFLDELAERAPGKGGPLALKLPRAPGAREPRWVHLLCGPVDVASYAVAAAAGVVPEPAPGELAALRDEVAQLRRQLDHLYEQLGVARP
jgi:uncharacterized protein YceH (UPF0502 family)